MDIERVELLNEVLKKSGHVDFWINKDVFELYNINEIVDKLKKQGLTVKVLVFEDVVRVIAKVKQ